MPIRDAYFLTRNPKKIREIAIFSFSKTKKVFPLLRGEKGVTLGWDKKNTIPGRFMYYIKHKYTIRSGLWAVIFTTLLPDTQSSI